MLAIVGGLGAAVAFATATVCVSVSSRRIGAASTLGWVLLTGISISVPWAVSDGVPDGLDMRSIGWLTVSGLGNVAGLFLAYSALRIGMVGLVAPIVSTEGAVAAVIALLAGEEISRGAGFLLAVIAAGIALAASSRAEHSSVHPVFRAPAYAVAAALSFGVSLYATGRASDTLPLGWAVAPPRVVGVLLVTLPLVLASRLRLTRDVLPFVVAAGIAEVAGFASYAVGARHGIAVSAVLASQFAAIAAVTAFFLFRERLTRVQLAGVAAVVTGVAALTIVQS